MRRTIFCLIPLALLCCSVVHAADTPNLVFAGAQPLALPASWSATEPAATPATGTGLPQIRNGNTQTSAVMPITTSTPTTQALANTRAIAATGTIRTSLLDALRQADVPAAAAKALTHVYASRDGLAEQIGPGDSFSVIYEIDPHGKPTKAASAVVAAAIVTDSGIYRAFRQSNAAGVAQYYDAKGQPYAPGIERTPLEYTIVSSFFSMSRDNPALGIVRRHSGVDLAAPAGTAVHAAAAGTVTFVGWRTGYGRLVKIKHGGGYATRYAHMAGFASGLSAGDHVQQGETIGYVGESGLATGYHLHFEIRKNGVAHDPLTMPLPDGKALSGPLLTAFTSRIQPLLARLSGHDAAPTMVASATRFQSCAQAGAINAVLALSPGQVERDALGDVFCSVGG